jgi:signal transduction histidine kinase
LEEVVAKRGWRWRDLPLRIKGLIVISIPLVPLLITGAMVVSSQRDAARAGQLANEALQVKAQLAHVLTLLVEAELGARGYLITRTPETLAAYTSASAALPEALSKLNASIRDPGQRQRLERIPQLAKGRPLTSIVEYVQATEPNAPMPLDLLRRSRATMSGLRRVIDEMQEAEDVLLAAESERARLARRQVLIVTGAGVALGLVGGVLAAVAFTAGVAGRISQASENAKRLADERSLLPMAPAVDEVGQLARALQQTSDLLRARKAELEHQVEQVSAVNRELESFSYSVSHDLRAPLRHIAGFATLLQKRLGAAIDPDAERYVRTIVEAAGRMGRLVDDLLGFSRMGRAEMLRNAVDLNELAADVLAEVAQEAAGRSITWRTGPLPTVNGDRAMLHQALANLVRNAVKYSATRTDAEIEIGSRAGDHGEQVVYVRDNGVGFDMAYGDKLFGVFQRLHAAEEFEGTGIGLANVRRIVQRHGGRTWAEGAVDRGATFYMSLPSMERTGSA